MLEFRTCFPSEALCHRKSETHLSSTVFPLTNWFSIFHERNKARTNSFLPRCSLSNISILVGLMMFKSINSWSWKSGVNLNLFGNIFWSIPLARPSKIRLTVKPGVGGGIFHSNIDEKWRWWTIIDGNKSWLFRNLLQKLDLHLVAKSRFWCFRNPDANDALQRTFQRSSQWNNARRENIKQKSLEVWRRDIPNENPGWIIAASLSALISSIWRSWPRWDARWTVGVLKSQRKLCSNDTKV